MQKYSGKGKYHHKQMESLMLNIINHALKFSINDPLLKKVSFTYVTLTNDKSILYVYCDSYDRSKIEKIVKELNDAKGVFRTELAHQLKTHKTPTVQFEIDKTIDNSLKIEELLNKLSSNKKSLWKICGINSIFLNSTIRFIFAIKQAFSSRS